MEVHVRSEESLLRRSPRALWRSVGAEVLLTARERDDFDHLSETAGMVWQILEVPMTLEDLVQALGDVYGLPAAEIFDDVARLVGDLRESGWIEVADEPAEADA
jgi:hypothetical protein